MNRVRERQSENLFSHNYCVVLHHTELMNSSEAIGGDALKFLEVLKKEKPGSGSIAASANDLQKVIRQLERLAGVSYMY